MAKVAFSWARRWAIVRAALGVAVALGAVALGYFVSGRIRGGGGGNLAGPGSAEKVERANTDAIKNLDGALDLLRRARDRSAP
jgi:hypothetical protein